MSSVSVVIPCYKYGNFLEECAASVLDDQEGVDVRVLIIDDASPDDSAEVAKKIAARDPRVELVVHAANQGNIATFNEGLLEWADGDYCVLLSADDRLTPGALRRAAALLDANPSVGFVYGHALWCVEGAPLPAARTRGRGWSVWPGAWWLERRFRQAENPIITPEVVVRTSLQKCVGGYDARLPKAADMELFMRLAANAEVGFIRGADQAYYRVPWAEHERSRERVDGSAPAAIGLRDRARPRRRQVVGPETSVRPRAPPAEPRSTVGRRTCVRPRSSAAERPWPAPPGVASERGGRGRRGTRGLRRRLLAGGEQTAGVPHSALARAHRATSDGVHAQPEGPVVATSPVMEIPGMLGDCWSRCRGPDARREPITGRAPVRVSPAGRYGRGVPTLGARASRRSPALASMTSPWGGTRSTGRSYRPAGTSHVRS